MTVSVGNRTSLRLGVLSERAVVSGVPQTLPRCFSVSAIITFVDFQGLVLSSKQGLNQTTQRILAKLWIAPAALAFAIWQIIIFCAPPLIH